MARTVQNNLAELTTLVGGLTRVVAAAAKHLQEAAAASLDTASAKATPHAATRRGELQHTFRALTRCVLLIRQETERIRALAPS